MNNDAYLTMTNQSTCGDVALRHLLAHYYKNNHYLLIDEKVKENGSLLEMINLASKYGLDLKGYQIDDNDYLKELKSPFIALINHGDGLHYVTIIKYKRDKFLYLDGYSKARWITFEQFSAIFHQYVLVIEEDINPNKRYISPLKPKIKNQTLLIILYMASCLCLISGLYLIEQNQHFIAPISLLTLAVLGYLLQKINMFKQLKNYDQLLLDKIHIKSKQQFEAYLKYKTFMISHPYLLINMTLLIVFPILLLVINDLYELISLFVLLLILVFNQLINKLMVNKKKRSLINQEDTLADDKFTTEQIKSILNSSYQLANLNININTISIFLIALMTLLVMAIRGHVYLNYFLFHFFAYYLIYEQANKLCDFKNNYQHHFQAAYRLID